MAGRQVVAPVVEIELDKVRHLKMDLNALALAEEVTGLSVIDGNGFNPHALSARGLRGFLWASLIWEDPDLTIEQVGSFIHMGNLTVIPEALGQAFQSALPEPDPDAPPKATETPSP